jgi:hypothetical protein
MNIGIDSGQCGIFDDTIYPADKKSRGKFDDKGSFYGECCQITLSKEKGGIMKNCKGLVSSSGFGDGIYDCCDQGYKGERIALMVDYGLARKSTNTRALVDSWK